MLDKNLNKYDRYILIEQLQYWKLERYISRR